MSVWIRGRRRKLQPGSILKRPRAQVITAAGEGSAAAIAINADLVEEDIRDALARAASPTIT